MADTLKHPNAQTIIDAMAQVYAASFPIPPASKPMREALDLLKIRITGSPDGAPKVTPGDLNLRTIISKGWEGYLDCEKDVMARARNHQKTPRSVREQCIGLSHSYFQSVRKCLIQKGYIDIGLNVSGERGNPDVSMFKDIKGADAATFTGITYREPGTWEERTATAADFGDRTP